MPLRLVTANERIAASANKNTMLVAGGFKIGKTTLARAFNPATTLFVNIEAGEKALADWRGNVTETIRTFDDALDIACLIGGVDPAIDESAPGGSDKPFCPSHYEYVLEQYIPAIQIGDYDTIFVDSYTRLSELCWNWAQQQPEAWTLPTRNRPSVFDQRACYGLMGRTLIKTLGHLHYSSARTIIYVGGLEKHTDEYKNETWRIEMVGQMASTIAPYIADTIISYDLFDTRDGVNWTHNPQSGEHRAFVCHKQNPFKLPAGDRSGKLEMMEEPNLRLLIDKMNKSA